MSNFFKNNLKIKPWHDIYLHKWHLYHSFYFRSTIKSGLKLKSFNRYLNLKYFIKIKENKDPSFLFFVAMLKLSPKFGLKIIRLGSGAHGVPLPINYYKCIFFSTK